MAFPTNPALEAGVIADVHSDAPRLVYADWLQENGDPVRAEYFRTQCALHDLSPADPAYPDLLESRLETHEAMYLRGIKPNLPKGIRSDGDFESVTTPGIGYENTRGFPFWIVGPHRDSKKAEVEKLRTAIPEILHQTTCRGLRFWSGASSKTVARILSHPDSHEFTALSLNNSSAESIGPVESVVQSPISQKLQRLQLTVYTSETLTTLIAAEFPRLHTLSLLTLDGGELLPTKTLLPLFKSDWFSRLHTLDWSASLQEDTPKVWGALAAMPNLHTFRTSSWNRNFSGIAKKSAFPSLGHLELSCLKFSLETATQFAAAGFPKLRSLELNSEPTHPSAFQKLISAPWFSRLRMLGLPGGRQTDEIIRTLAAQPMARELRSLNFNGWVLGGNWRQAVLESFPKLTTLSGVTTLLPETSEAEILAFLGGHFACRLRHLDLYSWPMSVKAAKVMAQNPSFAQLTRLNLTKAKLSPRALAHLLNSLHLQNLVSLNIDECADIDGVSQLLDPGVLPSLRFCKLSEKVGQKLGKKLRTARGDIFTYDK
jgi:uncharacterized protein (TIGR02996 family)